MKQGFSLVELSIVLVILGLLTGGILGGQSLMHAAELRAVTTEYNKYQTAIHTFKDKYFALPGDMNNAVKFWGAQAGGTADGADATCDALGFGNPAIGPETCNGNANGQVAWLETWRAWQHLANAGLIEGTYSGVMGAAGVSSYGVAGLNMPTSKLDNKAGFAFHYAGENPTPARFFPGSYGHVFYYGQAQGMDASVKMNAEDAWNIDSKMDDGKVAYGKMRGYIASHRPLCTTTDVATTAEYALTDTSGACAVVFITGF